MNIVLLYESEEWSTYALQSRIQEQGISCQLVCMEDGIPWEQFSNCDLVVSRLFASAQFRGHERSLRRMPELIAYLREKQIPMLNPYQAHFYEVSKELSTRVLSEHGLPVPKVYGTFQKRAGIGMEDALNVLPAEMQYPCIIKPNCGGRTTYTYIIHNGKELEDAVLQIPDIEMIVEEYIEPVHGFLTRIEVIGGECRLIVKRSVTENGLSAYHLGSKYQDYPDCSRQIRETSIEAMRILDIRFGSLDVIEYGSHFAIIDVNAVSNASEDNTEMFHFDLMKETAQYITQQYKKYEKEMKQL
ncbi:MAG TPA: hypothetical protein DDY31_06325 [Lachnospiraceae bacterium]|nr:hypothetical protein [Lachnospiraceae bacterium]